MKIEVKIMAKNREERKDELTESFRDFLWLLYNKQEISNDCVSEEDVAEFRRKLDNSAARLKPRTPFDVRIYVDYTNTNGEKKKLDPRMIDVAADWGFQIPDDAESITVRARMVAKRSKTDEQTVSSKRAKDREFKAQAGDETLFVNAIVICRSEARVKAAQKEHADLKGVRFSTFASLEQNSGILSIVPKAEYSL